MITLIGDIYLDLRTNTPVEVVGGRNQVWTGDGYRHLYRVENVLTGEHYNTLRRELSEERLNAMELIAWAAK